MEPAEKSLLIFSALGIASAIYWSIYVFYPADPFIEKIGVALNGVYLIGYILVVMTVCFGGVHLWHRSRS